MIKDTWFKLLAWATNRFFIKYVTKVVTAPDGTIIAVDDYNYDKATGKPGRFITRRLKKRVV